MTAKFTTARSLLFATAMLCLPAVAHAQSEPNSPVGTEASDPIVSPKPEPLAGYNQGFFIKTADDDFNLKIKLRFEGRANADITEGSDGKELSDANFRQNRTRLVFIGKARKELQYKLQLAFDKGNFSVKDAQIDMPIGSGDVLLRTGLFKQPFTRQFVGSSMVLTLVDRAITHSAYAPGRDIGFAFHNSYEKSPDVEWIVGVQNGVVGDVNNISVSIDDTDPLNPIVSGKHTANHPRKFLPTLIARVGINRGKDETGKGIAGYKEVDLEGGGLRYAIAAGTIARINHDDSDDQRYLGEVDYLIKTNGFSSNGAIVVDRTKGIDGLASYGFNLQVAQVLADKKHALAARLAMMSFADATGADDRNIIIEAVVGHSYFWQGHGYKVQTDLTIKDPGPGSFGDAIGVRSQFEVAF